MNAFNPSFLDDKALFGDLLHEYIHGKSSFRTAKTLQEIRIHIGSFRRWWLGHGRPGLTDETLLAWMLRGVQRAKVKTVAVKVIVLNHFFSFLVERNLLPINPLGKLRKGYRSIGFRGIIRELQRTGSVSAVIDLADHPFSGPLGRSCQGYLDYLAALGRRCDGHRYYLASFERFLRRRNVGAWSGVNRTVIEAWLQERRTRSAYQHRRILLVLEDLFQFLANEGQVARSPVPQPGPHRRRSLPPRIFTIEEVRAVLDETARLPDTRLMPFRGQTYRMLFLTLYTLGLRGNEALNLRLGDLDFTQHCLTIGQTKFYKGRVLPFGPRYEAALRSYIDAHPLLRGAISG